MSFLRDLYQSEIRESLKRDFGYRNDFEIPRLEKVSLNVAFKTVDTDNTFLKYIVEQLTAIAGQKAVLVNARKSISSFKLRENMPIACMVTLRGKKMYEFLTRLIYVVLPRIRDFRGLSSKSFNQRGHYSFGIREFTVFPEIDLDKAYKIMGMNIGIVTSAKSVEECKALLLGLNFPLK
ncbi:MAG: 50S ribosomal protein L5 [Rickettsiales bacterium]|jgi:large subunit ribosomal protein L5|nr:50S ribosomal protein L5 [Rickettsiales bacterium]